MRYFFGCLDEKHKLLGNFEKTFENLEKLSSENCKKCIILTYFSKKLTNHSFFCAFGRKKQFIGNFEKIFENSEHFSSENC